MKVVISFFYGIITALFEILILIQYQCTKTLRGSFHHLFSHGDDQGEQ